MPPLPTRKYRTNPKMAAFLTMNQRKQVAKMIRSERTKFANKKQYIWVASVSPLHSNVYGLNPLYSIALGDAYNQRESQTIMLQQMRLKLRLETNVATNKDATFRVLVYWDDQETFITTTSFTNVTIPNIQTTVPLEGDSSSSLQMPFVRHAATCIYDKYFNLPVSDTGIANAVTREVVINFRNKKVTFVGGATDFMNGKNLYVAIIGGVAGGTGGTTITGFVGLQGSLTFVNP